MENINTNLGKEFDVSKLYIGFYDPLTIGGVGLFIKDSIVSKDERHSYQLYKDILSDRYVAMRLDSQGNDFIKTQYDVEPGDPEERANWKGIIGATMYRGELELLPMYIEELRQKELVQVDFELGLIELSSAIPNLKSNLSLVEMVEELIGFCSKLNFKKTFIKYLTKKLESLPTYFENKNEKMPTFFNTSALELNEIDMSNIPKDFNTINHR